MADFLIEVPHEGTKKACMQAMDIFAKSGSHFLANASWGCSDNEHKAWLIIDVDSKDQAKQVLPLIYRKDAKITKLFKIPRSEFEYYNKEHDLNKTGKFHPHHKQ